MEHSSDQDRNCNRSCKSSKFARSCRDCANSARLVEFRLAKEAQGIELLFGCSYVIPYKRTLTGLLSGTTWGAVLCKGT